MGRALSNPYQAGRTTWWSRPGNGSLVCDRNAAIFAVRICLMRADSALTILRFQSLVVLALVLGLALWGLSTILADPGTRSQVVWSVGYLSIAALYSVILGLRAFDERRHVSWRILGEASRVSRTVNQATLACCSNCAGLR
jgi:hypothetical protein